MVSSTSFPMQTSVQFRSSESIKLIHEAIRNRENPHIFPYRDDLVKSSIQEILALDSAPSKSQTIQKMKTLFIDRTKRCVLAYQRERMDRYIDLLWLCGATTASVLPEKSLKAASIQESSLVLC
jgi:GINS complex subunit 1